ncbi:hypothetical protein DSM104299_03192 [Baekduia alba]|uniref:hypothetical protein n=1 Tax=Baekduia alba TaxID=2997333 RepID=UPI002341CBB8|nr:hypothetical protein [Baekduia alba]WCB94455.1 hypothetical protein DSM104299_03192 [Baekduia alba]
MTTLVEWHDFGIGPALTYEVNGAVSATITRSEAYEVRDSSEWRRLVLARIAPLVWLAMPVHDSAGDRWQPL